MCEKSFQYLHTILRDMNTSILCFVCGFLTLVTPIVSAQSSPELLQDARAGDVEAMRKLGKRLLKGVGVRAQDIPNGAKWLKKASELGDAEASCLVAMLYEEGVYYGKSKKKAIEYYRLAASQGSEKAIKRLQKLAPNQPIPQPSVPASPVAIADAPSSEVATSDSGDFLDSLDKQYSGATLVYECEILISDNFVLADKYRVEKYSDLDLKKGKRPILTQFKKSTREWYEATHGNREEIMAKQAKAAILGLRDYSFPCSDRCNIPGALILCLSEANTKIMLSDGKSARMLNDYVFKHTLDELWDAGATNGTFYLGEEPLFHYTTSVEWENGLPKKAKARIDFSPAKSRIIKRVNVPR